MNKLKYIIILLIISIIIVTGILIYILTSFVYDENAEEDVSFISKEDTEINIQIEDRELKYVDERNEYFAVEKCIRKYVLAEILKNQDELYSYYDQEFIKENSITINNVLDFAEEIDKYTEENFSFIINDMYTIKDEDLQRVYFIYGKIGNANETLNQDFNIMVRMDKENDAFSILPSTYMNKHNYLKLELGDVVNDKFESIEKNEYNSFNYEKIKDNEMILNYLSDFYYRANYEPEYAFKLLDPEYRLKRYQNDIEEFKTNMQYREIATLNNYNYKEYKDEGYTIYQCEDGYGLRYIIKETAVMQYTIQLDDYTLDNEYFNEMYDNADNMQKGVFNIQRFFEMINTGDYKAAYGVLDENFKNNYFKTQRDFENYMKNNIFKYNHVEGGEYSNDVTNLHVYKITLTDNKWESEEEKNFNIVLKLLDNRKFVMSFEVSN